MNTKGTKFLAVLAVLAMVFASVAIVTEVSDASQAEVAFVDTGQSFTVSTGESTTQEVKIYAQETLTSSATSSGAAFSGYTTNYSPAFYTTQQYYAAYGEVGIFFGDLSTAVSGGSISITQKTSFGSLFKDHLEDRQSYDATAGTMTSIFNTSSFNAATYVSEAASPAFGVLVPQDGSKVTLTISTYDGPMVTSEGAHKYACSGNLLGTTTYVLDFSDATTKIILTSDAISTELWSEQKWTWGGSGDTTLTFTDATSLNAAFEYAGAITMVLPATKTVSLEAYAPNGVIHANDALIIKSSVQDSTATLNVKQTYATAHAIDSGSSVTIGDGTNTTTATADVKLKTEGGSIGIYSSTTMTFKGADVDASAGEKAIRPTTGLTTTNYNNIVAKIDGTYSTNQTGNDDIFGIKVGQANSAATAGLSANTKVVTDGFRLNSTSADALTLTSGAILIVKGDYEQMNYADVLGVAGIYIDKVSVSAGATAVYKATQVASASDVDSAGLYAVAGAGAYNVQIQNTSGTVIDVTTATASGTKYDSAAAWTAAIVTAVGTASSATVKLSGAAESAETLDLATVMANTTLSNMESITFIADTVKTLSGSDDVDVSSQKITFKGLTVSATFVNGTDMARVSAMTGTFSVSEGSVHIDGSVDSGTIYIDGDADLSGTLTGTLSLIMDPDADEANLTVLEGFTINGGTLNLTSIALTVKDKISVVTGTVYFKTGTTFDSAVKIVAETSATVKSDVAVTKDLTLSGAVGAAVAVGTDLSVKNITLNAPTVAFGAHDLTVSGALKITDAVTTGVTFTGASTSALEAVTVEGDADIAGILTLSNATLALKGTTTLSGKILYGASEKNVVTNSGTMTVSTTGVIGNTATTANSAKNVVNNGVMIIKGTVIDLTNNKTVRLYGNIGYSTPVGALVNEGTVIIMDAGANIYASRTGTGTIDKSAVVSDAYLTGDIVSSQSTTFTEWQRVIVDKTTNLKTGAQIVIKGDMVVSDGITMTIENGAFLKIDGSFAKLTNNGNISVAGTYSDAVTPIYGALFINGAEVENNGTIASTYDGTAASPMNIALYNNTVFKNNGTITIAENNVLAINATGTSFVNAGAMTIEGQVTNLVGATPTIINSAAITMKSAAQQNLIISNSASGAIVNVTAAYGALTINDAAFKTTSSITGANSIVPAVGDAIRTSDTDATIGGFIVTEGTFKDANNSSKVTPRMIISGDVELDTSYTDLDVTVAGKFGTITLTGFVDVTDALAVEEGIKVILGSIETLIKISGIMGIDDGSITALGSTSASMIVTGALYSYGNTIAEDIDLTAAAYLVPKTSDSPKCYVYTTVDEAITGAEAASVWTVYVYGEVNDGVTDGILVSNSVTVPVGMSVRVEAGDLVIGKDVVFSVPYDSSKNTILNLATGSGVLVNGKLYFQDQSKGLKGSAANIESEVVLISGAAYTYTTLAWAISDIGTEEATLTLSGDTLIKSNTTIPGNVTVDTNGFDFGVDDEVTLTIDGTLFLNGGDYTVSEDDAKVVLNGFITKESAMTYDGLAYPAGLYYSVEDAASYVITSIDNAEISALVADGKMVYYGDLTTTAIEFDAEGIIEFTGKVSAKSLETGSKAKITFDKDVSIDSVLMGVSTLVFAEGIAIDGTFASTVGSIAIAEAYAVKDTTLAVATADGETTMTLASGKIGIVDDDDYDVTTYGDFVLKADVAGLTVGSGVTLVGANVTVAALEVDGTMIVDNGYTLTAPIAVVNGTLAAKEATSTASKGSVDIVTLTAGMELLDVASAAIITGDVSADYAYVSYASTVPESISEMAYSTVVFVEGDAVMVIYGISSVAIGDIQEVFDLGFSDPNAEFNGWVDLTGKAVLNPKIGSPEAIYADLDYDVYTVYILTDSGVKSVSIDGMELIAYGDNVYVTKLGDIGYNLSAGSYKVTYTLKSGYEGNAQLYTKAGTILKDNKFIISPGEDSLNVELQLNGTQKEVTPEPEPTPTPEEKSEWTITTILLLVLVILIAIMAVIVALRLNRN